MKKLKKHLSALTNTPSLIGEPKNAYREYQLVTPWVSGGRWWQIGTPPVKPSTDLIPAVALMDRTPFEEITHKTHKHMHYQNMVWAFQLRGPVLFSGIWKASCGKQLGIQLVSAKDTGVYLQATCATGTSLFPTLKEMHRLRNGLVNKPHSVLRLCMINNTNLIQYICSSFEKTCHK